MVYMPQQHCCCGMHNIYCDYIHKIFYTGFSENFQLGANVGEMVPALSRVNKE